MDVTHEAALRAHLDAALGATRDLRSGLTAQYIPELANADPEPFAAAISTVGGDLIAVGDTGAQFTLQSTCKPFLYATALAAFGRRSVRQRVGVEPTGEAFHSFIGLEAGRKRPHNPMVNTGAIAVAGMLARDHLVTPADVVAHFRDLAGGPPVTFDARVFASERATGHRNRAIAYLLRQSGVLDVAPEIALDRYLEACSVLTTVEGLASLAGLLAAGGRRPSDGRRVLPRWAVGDTLAVMSTCGMYDAAGHFAFDVGIPAKSGVSGALMAVVPDRFGIAVFSPRLDEQSTSVRGLQVLRRLAEHLSLHPFDAPAERTPAERPARGRAVRQVGGCQPLLDRIVRARRPFGRQLPAQYAPQLAAADVATTAMAVCTVDGVRFASGEHRAAFSIQAAANPFAYAAALEHVGVEATHRRVGVEPSGNPADAIRLQADPVRPFNPMENAGAIAVADLLRSAPPSGAGAMLSRFAGRALVVDDQMLAEEVHAGGRNRAIAALLHAAGIVEDEDAALDRYFRQCSVVVDARTLARMAAVLASHGIDPVTKARVISPQTARHVMSVMYTAGMHNASGEFAVSVGMPSKSGISGCIFAVAPGRMGVAVYAPGVDVRGFSVRGAAMLRDLSRQLDLRILTPHGRRPSLRRADRIRYRERDGAGS